MTKSSDFDSLMQRGSQLFEEGQTALALVEFQKAHALAPTDINAASACATLLSHLNQPQAAYQVLNSLKALLWHDADGVANLAITAEACGQMEEARQAYLQALALNPNHVRSLNNLALMASAQGQFDEAVDRAFRCVELLPLEPLLWMNLADFLTGAHREPEALVQLDEACKRFPDSAELALRRYVSLAFNARFDEAQLAFARLGPQADQMLGSFLQQAVAHLPRQFQVHSPTLPDAFEFYTIRAFDALTVCNWQKNDHVKVVLGEMLKNAQTSSALHDWRDALFYALFLDLTEPQETQLRAVTRNAIDQTQKRTPQWLPLKNRAGPTGAKPANGRFRIGIATQHLSDKRFARGLLEQLALHDFARFEFHLYTPSPAPDPDMADKLQARAALIEIGHMTDAEAAARTRLDRLDLWMDTTFFTHWCRPELAALQVAPVQIRHQTWLRMNLPFPCQYTMGDVFTHPGEAIDTNFGAIARLPHTCWLASGQDEAPAEPLVREQAHLPTYALVLCSFGPALMVDPHTFSQWMKILKALPDAVLWLPSYTPETRSNLLREAAIAGTPEHQIIFADRSSRTDLLAQLPLADLFLDTLRFNANHNLVDALRLGVPAVTVAGHNMASRLGGSIIGAAGLADCVHDSAAGYVNHVIDLGRNPAALAALRQRVQPGNPPSPLFDLPARVREWEVAWTHMIERQRAGLAPQAFDIPASPATRLPS